MVKLSCWLLPCPLTNYVMVKGNASFSSESLGNALDAGVVHLVTKAGAKKLSVKSALHGREYQQEQLDASIHVSEIKGMSKKAR